MAKPRTLVPVIQIENALRYKIDFSRSPDESAERFYSDLTPVPKGIDERAQRELEEYRRRHGTEREGSISKQAHSEFQEQTISNGEDTVVLKKKPWTSLYNFTVDIRYGFGLNVSLQFTKDEASRAMAVNKLKHRPLDTSTSRFFRLPKELRDRIYTFAATRREWRIEDTDEFTEMDVAGGIADPTGFFFPMRKDLNVLMANRQMRLESLPFAYRCTSFHLDDIEDFIRFSISIGKFGRDNVESLEFAWESRSDSERRWNETPDRLDYCSKPPSLHVSKCVQLLNQFRRLKNLRLHFDYGLISNTPFNDLKGDTGISELCSLKGLDRVEIWDFGYLSLQDYDIAFWLKENMESPKREDQYKG